ncbi:MAG: Ricin B lectin, partial [Parcubacteria group bacterium GW2011_GWA2_47_10]
MKHRNSLNYSLIFMGLLFAPFFSLAQTATPLIQLSATPLYGQPPLTVTFTATPSNISLCGITETWDFGDGNSLSSADLCAPYSATPMPVASTITHTYNSAGTYVATFKISQTTSNSVSVVVLNSCGSLSCPTPTPIPSSVAFTLLNSGDVTVLQGQSVVNSLSSFVSPGALGAVSYLVAGLPSGSTYSLSPSSCTPPCGGVIIINTSLTTTPGTYAVTVYATGSGLTAQTIFNFTVLPVSSTPPSSSLQGQLTPGTTACMPRPACLDSVPRCLIAEPSAGWCSTLSSGGTAMGSIVCTQEVKLCSDGSYVSRKSPTCEFAACPVANQTNTTTGTVNSTPGTVNFASNLYFGMNSLDVVLLQQTLQQLGYFSAATQPTGYFGTITANAVRLFQTAYNISATGYVGTLTRAALADPSLVTSGTTQVCTQDVKQCSDGSYVSRMSPTCEFATCSGSGNISDGGGIIGSALLQQTPTQQQFQTQVVQQTNKFIIGDRVQTTVTLNVRATPSLTGILLGSQPTGALGTVIGGPFVANGPGVTPDGYIWWNINYDNAPDGWSVENFLAKALPVPPPPPQSKIPLSFSYHISDKLDKAGGPFINQSNHPLLDSVIVNVKWALAEPARGTYDWSLLDKKITQWTGTSGKKVILKIAPYGADPADGEEGDSDDNDTTPSWVYDTGVPRISFVGSHARQVSLPKVWDPNFYPPYEEFIKALGERYNNDPRVAGFMVGIGHNGNVNAQGSKGGGLAFVAAGWTLPTWEKHISEVIRISQKHLSKPLTMGSASAFLDKYRLENNPDAAKRVFGDAALKGISLIFGGMHPNLDNFNKSFVPELVRHLATLNPPASFTIGFHDDWPLWVPPHRSEKCPSPTCGRNVDGFDKEFQYVFDLWNSINRKYPIFFR